jgi:cytochrome c553
VCRAGTRGVFLVTLLAAGVMAHAAGDAEAGKAAALVCAACHGQDGATGIDPTYPNLAGQNERYLLRQLELIQSGERPAPLMTGQLTGKSRADLENLAAYFASLPAKGGQAAGGDDAVARAAAIYRGGILDKGVAACSACHGPDGTGNWAAGFPQIGGQAVAYTVAQLTAYREGRRSTDEDYGGMMRDVASRLTDGEIAALADFLRGLH